MAFSLMSFIQTLVIEISAHLVNPRWPHFENSQLSELQLQNLFFQIESHLQFQRVGCGYILPGTTLQTTLDVVANDLIQLKRELVN